MPELTPDLLLLAYAEGVFPMSESRDDPEIFWVDPQRRGVFVLEDFHISRSLARTLRRGHFNITVDTAFEDVVRGCANRDDTWINGTIFALYSALHARGDAHSVEVWQDGRLVGGVYGVVIGAAFFGESMFSTATDASKVALAHLVDILRRGDFQLFDTQFLTPHLARLGAVEIARANYLQALAKATRSPATFSTCVAPAQDVIQRNAHTS